MKPTEQYKRAANAAVMRIKEYLIAQGIEKLPTKHNELFKHYFAFENIDTKGKKLRDLAVIAFNTGKLDKYKPKEKKTQVKIKTVKIKKSPPKKSFKAVENFYQSQRWIDTKKVVYSLYDFKCMKCGTKDKEMHVDHICPVSKHQTLKWSINNLQLLCKDCNIEKSNVNEIDYRTIEQKDLCLKYMNGEI